MSAWLAKEGSKKFASVRYQDIDDTDRLKWRNSISQCIINLTSLGSCDRYMCSLFRVIFYNCWIIKKIKCTSVRRCACPSFYLWKMSNIGLVVASLWSIEWVFHCSPWNSIVIMIVNDRHKRFQSLPKLRFFFIKFQ